MIKKDFDDIILKNLLNEIDQSNFGYTIPLGTYEFYYNESAFSEFLDEMKASYPHIFEDYSLGKFSEIKANSKHPPKMASVASSSRFCYLALRDGAKVLLGDSEQIKFEYSCAINGISGNSPQIDAYIPNENIFIEAKCHEIFDRHSIKMKRQYWKLIYGLENEFGFSVKKRPVDDEFKIPLSEFGIEKPSLMFDLKQFLCHLWGIASKKFNSASLVYLFFKPKASLPEEQNEIEQIFIELQAEIKTIFESVPIQNFIAKNNLQLRAVAEYAEVMEPLTADNMIILY